ncbi:MAG TPA: DUF4340 domain-containing protein [Steroidobacteraceae bacterium]|jgi:hypothetical protein
MIRPGQVVALIVAGVALAGAGVWLVSRHDTQGQPQVQSQVLQLTPEQLNSVTRVRIFKGDGSHVTLKHDGTRWMVTERDYPADTGLVRKLLLNLASLKREEEKTADPALYIKLGVEDPVGAQATSTGLDVDLSTKTQRLIVGKTSGTESVYLRVAGEAQSLLASPQLTPDADPRHWLDHSLLDISPDQVSAIEIKVQGTPDYSIKRAATGGAADFVVAPIPKGRTLADPSAPAAQAGALAALQLDDVRKAGTATAAAQAVFQTRDGLTLTIAGIKDGELRYITVAASATAPAAQAQARDLNARLAGWQFELPGYRYDGLFKPIEQLLVPKKPASSRSSPLPAPKQSPVAPSAAPSALPIGPPNHAGDSH